MVTSVIASGSMAAPASPLTLFIVGALGAIVALAIYHR